MITDEQLGNTKLANVVATVTNSVPFLGQVLGSSSIANLIRDHAQIHECGYLFWESCIGSLEVVVIAWQPGSISEAHDHKQAENVVIGLAGEVTVLRYHYSRNQRFLAWQETLRCANLSHTPAWASHEVINHTSEWAVTLHIYWPRRN